MANWNLPIILGSNSPRRMQLLQSVGINPIVSAPAIDDSVYSIGEYDVAHWVQALAILKSMHIDTKDFKAGTILTADTVCVIDGRVFGKPEGAHEARLMIEKAMGETHQVYTGWCLKSCDGVQSVIGYESTDITMGHIETKVLDSYIESGNWSGKAGGYNVSERIEAGWPIEFLGDLTCAMGLPMTRLKSEFAHLGSNN